MEKRGGYHKRGNDPDVQISKNLSWLLRHGAEKEGLAMDAGGWVELSDVLNKDFYKSKKIDVDKIKEIVETNDKKRFELKTQPNKDGMNVLFIRASQGHTLKVKQTIFFDKMFNVECLGC